MDRRTLIIQGRKLVKQGEGTYGPWTLYQLDVTDQDGLPVDGNFKTFADTPIGVPVLFDVEERYHERYGTSYTLKPVDAPKSDSQASGGTDGLEMVRESVQRVLERVNRLEVQVFGRVGGQPPVFADPAQTDTPAPAHTVPSPKSRDDEIPF